VSGRAWLLAAAALAVIALAIGLLFMARPSDLAPQSQADRRDATLAQEPHPLPPRDAALPVSRPPPAPDASGEPAEQRTARADRQQIIGALHDSGSGTEPWSAQGTAVLDVIAHAGGTQSEGGCYVAGCGAVFTFESESDYRRGVDTLLASEAFRAWTGGKRFASPERLPDGRVIIAIALYRPD
jgi:hypothetical protein